MFAEQHKPIVHSQPQLALQSKLMKVLKTGWYLILALCVIGYLACGEDEEGKDKVTQPTSQTQTEAEGTEEENKAFMRRYLDALSGKDKPAATVNQYVTAENLRQHIAVFEAAFPRYEVIVEDMIAKGDKVVVRGTASGTHQGEFLGIPPTGKTWSITAILIYRIAGGKIVEFWGNADMLTLMQQLGAVTAPGQAGE